MQRGRNYPGGGLYVQRGAVSSQQLEQHNERQNIQLDSQPTWFDLVCSIDLVDASFNMSYYVYYMSPYFCSWGESWLDNPFQGTWKRSLKPSQATCLAECFPILKLEFPSHPNSAPPKGIGQFLRRASWNVRELSSCHHRIPMVTVAGCRQGNPIAQRGDELVDHSWNPRIPRNSLP